MKKWLLNQIGINWLIEKFARISYWVFAGAAFLLLCGGIVLGALVERKEVAVALVFASTLLGTSILSLVLPKVLAQVIDDEREKTRMLEEKLKAEKAAREAQEKLREADLEIERLERMQLSLQALKPIANLSLLSVEMIIKDFDRWVLNKRETPTISIPNPIGEDIPVKKLWQKQRQMSYTGAIEIPVTAHLGVDLHKVKVRAGPNGSLIIGGLSMTTTADTVRPTEYPLTEIRTEIYDGDKVDQVQINPSHEKLLAERDKHDRKLRERISAGQSFKVFEKPVLQNARDALKLLLSPLGLEITFEDQVHLDSQPLFGFLASEQNKIEHRRRELGRNLFGRANTDERPAPVTLGKEN